MFACVFWYQLAESARKRSDEALQTLLSEHRQLIGEIASGTSASTTARSEPVATAPRGLSAAEVSAAVTGALESQMDGVVAEVAKRVDESVKEALLQHLLESDGGRSDSAAIKQEAFAALSENVTSLRSDLQNVSKQLASLQQTQLQAHNKT